MKLANALRRLTQSWWRVDRLRVSPDEGLLLRLTPPCYLRLAGQTVEVFNRRRLADHVGVVYDCRTEPDNTHAELQVLFAGLRQPLGLLFCSPSGEFELAPADIQIFNGE